MIFILESCAPEEEIKLQAMNTTKDGIAVGGYDPVSYFDGLAQAGSAAHQYEWRGAKFLFASDAHRDTFAKHPEQFVPQYGGYCSFGMGFGKPTTADPNAFVVQDGKLYLNASPMVRRFWKWFGNADKSDAKWRELKSSAGLL